MEVTENTIRRWADMLEQAGYEFNRSESGSRRIYTDQDLRTLRKLKRLSDKYPLEEAAQEAVKNWKAGLEKTPIHDPATEPSSKPADPDQGAEDREDTKPDVSVDAAEKNQSNVILLDLTKSAESETLVSSPAQAADYELSDSEERLFRRFDRYIAELMDSSYWMSATALKNIQQEWQQVKEILKKTNSFCNVEFYEPVPLSHQLLKRKNRVEGEFEL